ncbi:hypothetical protein MBLNU459_g1502t1 [Dothideomycetes sp. NU459]
MPMDLDVPIGLRDQILANSAVLYPDHSYTQLITYKALDHKGQFKFPVLWIAAIISMSAPSQMQILHFSDECRTVLSAHSNLLDRLAGSVAKMILNARITSISAEEQRAADHQLLQII